MSVVQEIQETTTTDIDNNRGRPTKYYSHVQPRLQEIEQWLKDGYTEYSICESLQISHQAWIDYKRDYPELMECFTRARTHKTALVMHKMFEKATGYEHEDLYITQHQGVVIKEPIKKHYPPDVNAADLYLRNNDPNYKGSKDIGNVTLNQYNFNRPQLESELKKLDNELKALEAVEVEVIEKE